MSKDKIEALKFEIKELEEKVERFSSMEQAVKIVLNSGYGAIGAPQFRWYDETIAEGITTTGQIAIRYISKKINEFINKESNTTDVDYILSSDTDSVVGSTMLITNIGDISISDLYDTYSDSKSELKQNEKDSVRTLNELVYSASYDGNNLIYKKINYIMKHKIYKKMYRIKLNDTHVDVTEDHSLMVLRNGKMISVEPLNIKDLDLIIQFKRGEVITTKDFEIILLGLVEDYVYDIEVEDTHNFFGNNILVHNSTYVGIESVVKKKWPDITDKQKLTDLIDDYAENVLGTYIEECYNKLSEYLNCDINLLDMKREAIADTFIIRAKKNYIMRIYDNEGIRFADPYYKMMGIEVVRTSHPIMVRDALEEALKIVIDGTNEELRSFVSKFKDEFMSAPLNKIGSPRGVSDVTKYSTDDHRPKEFEMVLDESGKFVKKKVVVPIHVTAAINYNRLVSEKKLSNRYEYIRNGSKIKFLPLKEPNPLKSHVIGFVDVMPEEFEISEYIDKESHWEKIFVKPLETFLIYNGWTIEENTLVDLFGDSIDIAKAAIGIKKQSKKKEAKQVSSLF